MIIKYNVSGDQRKLLVQALSKMLDWQPQYMGAPSFAYKIGNYTVTKDGNVECPTSTLPDMVGDIIMYLKKYGFVALGVDEDRIVVEIPAIKVDKDTYDRLTRLIASKSTILKKALKTDSLPIDKGPEKIAFPWFTATGTEGEANAYAQLISAMIKLAKRQKRVSDTERPSDNDKLTMRLFLVRLGFVGDEYKVARKILTRNLTGNSSWKVPPKASRAEEIEEPDESESAEDVVDIQPEAEFPEPDAQEHEDIDDSFDIPDALDEVSIGDDEIEE